MLRYLRLYLAFARFSLARELAFRGNFLVKIFVEVLWLFLLLIFYRTVFAKTSIVAGWSEPAYLFFVGCYFALEGVLETLFLENCNEFADLVRSGDLDFYLLKPIDEQFLLSCRNIDWSTAPNLLMGAGVMVLALAELDAPVSWANVVAFVLLFACGMALAYSFLLMLTSASVWLMRNQSLYEMWWLFTSLMRYPREVFLNDWAAPLGWFFSFVVPILLVVYVPAALMVQLLDDPRLVAFTAAMSILMVLLSRRVFRAALRHYRSASS
ncbi:MAG: ABC-2 family transporter protein [Gemmataceae bacterium]|nr:ABC-2 family transporter protein [Gemmataceae bacterium]MDW8266184.1 ABC-2 family transporter protein [Gemmataceae bacterium]